jgi:hypothetical protein
MIVTVRKTKMTMTIMIIISFQFINQQAILKSSYYEPSTKTENTKTVKYTEIRHKNSAVGKTV